MRGGIGCELFVGLVAIAGQAAAQELKILFPPPDLPVLKTSLEGVQLADGRPIIYYRGEIASPPEGARPLPKDQGLVQSREWSQVLLFGREGADKTWFERTPSLRRSAKGDLRFAIDTAGRTTIAFSKEGDERVVLSLGPEGEVLATVYIRGLRWVSVSDDGARFALGTDSFVRVLDRSGVPVLPDLREASASGALSPDGSWLALDVTTGPERLRWIPLRQPAAQVSFDVSAPGQVVFAATGDLAAHVAPREVAIFRLDAGGLQPVKRHLAPADFVWASAAFDDQGRLALGRIHVKQHPKREPTDKDNYFRPGAADLGVDFFPSAAGDPVASAVWEVPIWNYAAPALAFAADGRCIADTGHSCSALEPPWSH